MIHSLPPVVSVIIAVVLCAISGVAVAAGVHARKIARTIASLKTSRIAAAVDSYVALEGTVKAINGQTLVAPLTQAACCWFHVKVEESTSHGDSSRWDTVGEHSSHDPFLLHDATGECAVYPSGAEVTPTDRSVWYGPTAIPQDRKPPRRGPGDSAEGMLRVEGVPSRKFRYTEERIYDGDPLYALGRLVPTVGADEEDDDEHDDSGSLHQEVKPHPPSDQKSAFKDGSWLGKNTFELLDRMVKEITARKLVSPYSRHRPFLLYTTPRQKLLEVNRRGSTAALFVAALPLGVALMFLWFRFR